MKKLREDEAGFQFPCAYQIKAMGHDDGAFREVVVNIIEQHCDKVKPEHVICKPSRNGKYLSVSVTVQAHSHDHLDAIYATLTEHDKVLMRL